MREREREGEGDGGGGGGGGGGREGGDVKWREGEWYRRAYSQLLSRYL